MLDKALSIVAICFTFVGASSAWAQNSRLDEARAELQAGRDQIIREDLQLSDAELASFWPVYQDYVAALAPLRDRKAELISQFMTAYQSGEFDDSFAAWLIDENFALKEDWMRVQKQFVPRFREVLAVQAVARFIQLENKMDAEVDAQLAIAIPLVE